MEGRQSRRARDVGPLADTPSRHADHEPSVAAWLRERVPLFEEVSDAVRTWHDRVISDERSVGRKLVSGESNTNKAPIRKACFPPSELF